MMGLGTPSAGSDFEDLAPPSRIHAPINGDLDFSDSEKGVVAFCGGDRRSKRDSHHGRGCGFVGLRAGRRRHRRSRSRVARRRDAHCGSAPFGRPWTQRFRRHHQRRAGQRAGGRAGCLLGHRGRICLAGRGRICLAGRGRICLAGRGRIRLAGRGRIRLAGRGRIRLAGRCGRGWPGQSRNAFPRWAAATGCRTGGLVDAESVVRPRRASVRARREDDSKGRAFSRFDIHIDPPSVGADDAMHDGET